MTDFLKYLNNLEVMPTGKFHDNMFHSLTTIKDSECGNIPMKLKEYKIYITLGRKAICTKQELDHVKKRVKHEIKDVLYGKICDSLYELESIIYSGNRSESLEKIEEMLGELL